MFDLAILGGGPAGYTAAEKAQKAGMSVVLFEKEALGGTCLNVGCIPTKTLLYSAKQYVNAKQAAKYGVQAGELSFDYQKIQQRKQKIVRKLVAGIKQRLQGVTIVVGDARCSIDNAQCTMHDGGVTVTCGEETYEAKRLLICTGSSNFVPPIPGIEGNEHVWSSTDALNAKELPKLVAIVGGGVIGMEFATLYMELGVPVTVIEALPNVLATLDPDVVALVRQKYEKEGVRFLVNTRVTSIEGKKVYVDPSECIEADKILVCVGRRANMQGLEGLTGLQTERKGIVVDEHMRTNLPNVWAAGDVTGRVMLAHVASRQAEVAVDDMLGREAVMRYDAIPSVVYTNPEIASVGAGAPNVNVNVTPQGGYENENVIVKPMTYSGRFVAENEGETGLCKLVLHEGRVAGVHMVGNPCSEFVAAATFAVMQHATPEMLEEVIFPHPTVSEILKEMGK